MDSELARLRAQLDQLMAPRTSEDTDAIEKVRRRADAVLMLHGKEAPPALTGETPLAYRRRCLAHMAKHTTTYAQSRFDSCDASMLAAFEQKVTQEARAKAYDTGAVPAGTMRAVHETDPAGRTCTRWVGDNMAWMQHFMSGPATGYIPRPK